MQTRHLFRVSFNPPVKGTIIARGCDEGAGKEFSMNSAKNKLVLYVKFEERKYTICLFGEVVHKTEAEAIAELEKKKCEKCKDSGIDNRCGDCNNFKPPLKPSDLEVGLTYLLKNESWVYTGKTLNVLGTIGYLFENSSGNIYFPESHITEMTLPQQPSEIIGGVDLASEYMCSICKKPIYPNEINYGDEDSPVCEHCDYKKNECKEEN